MTPTPTFQIPTLKNVVLLVPRMLGATFSAAVEVFYLSASNSWPDAERGGSALDAQIPQVGRIFWTAGVGDRVQHKLRVTNTASRAQDFAIRVARFRGTDVSVDLDVSVQRLEHGQSFDAIVSLSIPPSLAGGRYTSSIVVHAAWRSASSSS